MSMYTLYTLDSSTTKDIVRIGFIKALFNFNKSCLYLKKTDQDDFQFHVNWVIFNIKFISDINA